MVVHAFHPRTWEAEAVWGQSELRYESISQTNTTEQMTPCSKTSFGKQVKPWSGGEKKKVELIVYGLFIGLVAETGPRMRSFWLRFVNSLSESQVEAMQGPNVLRMSPRQGGKTCLPAVHLGEKSRFIFHLSTVNLDYLLATISPGQYCQPCRYCLA